MSNKEREHLKDYEYTQAVAMNGYLKDVPNLIREQIIERILSDICIHCFSCNEGVCYCMNDK